MYVQIFIAVLWRLIQVVTFFSLFVQLTRNCYTPSHCIWKTVVAHFGDYNSDITVMKGGLMVS